jgi:hypothetical protein
MDYECLLERTIKRTAKLGDAELKLATLTRISDVNATYLI